MQGRQSQRAGVRVRNRRGPEGESLLLQIKSNKTLRSISSSNAKGFQGRRPKQAARKHTLTGHQTRRLGTPLPTRPAGSREVAGAKAWSPRGAAPGCAAGGPSSRAGHQQSALGPRTQKDSPALVSTGDLALALSGRELPFCTLHISIISQTEMSFWTCTWQGQALQRGSPEKLSECEGTPLRVGLPCLWKAPGACQAICRERGEEQGGTGSDSVFP